ncbi:hypothetical protein K7432_002797 [Basidiobolus ranarum]|uniref:Uncharacterized protein n=1 Tax=Basidiobolus ranarum TaxID=34480 RepID=A0ABR2X187_9FUNG
MAKQGGEQAAVIAEACIVGVHEVDSLDPISITVRFTTIICFQLLHSVCNMSTSSNSSVTRNAYTWTRGNYFISTDPRNLDLNFVYEYISSLKENEEPLCRNNFKRILNFSLCFGLFVTLPKEYGSLGMPTVYQIGFARVATDYIRLAYLCNIHISEAYEGLHIREWLMDIVLNYPGLQSIHWVVRTADIQENASKAPQKRELDPSNEQYPCHIQSTHKKQRPINEIPIIAANT